MSTRHRLAAIWFADIVGFSAISATDQRGAVRLAGLFQVVAREAVERYGGRIVKFLGDGALAEFQSAQAAIAAAHVLRDSFAERAGARGFETVALRIGIHAGEVVESEGDVYGDGVNVAERVQGAAEPGDILVTEDVWRQGRQHADMTFEPLGRTELKGVGAIDLYRSRLTTKIEPEEGRSYLAGLVEELKRRHVFRVAAAYAAVAFIVLQVASLTFDPLRLPDWALTLVVVLAIAGFPISLVVAWAFELTPEGVRRTSPSTPDTPGPSRRPSVPGQAIAAAILALIVGAGVLWAWRTRGAGESEGPPISESMFVVMPFEVRGTGGDLEYLGEGMVSLVGTKLKGADDVRSVDPNALLQWLEENPARPSDIEAGRRAARRFGAAHFLLGTILEGGEKVRIDAYLYRMDGEEAVAQVGVEGSAGDVFSLVDDLVGRLLVERSEVEIGRLAGLAALTTDSLDALKSYLEGEREYRAGRYERAMGAFEHAVATDSLFSLAHFRLAMAASWIPDVERMQRAADAAVRHAGRLAPGDRRIVEAFHAMLNSDFERTERLLRGHLDARPDDVEAWFLLGDVLLHSNALRGRSAGEAAEPFDRALAFDPDNAAYLEHRMEVAASQRDFAAIDSLLGFLEPTSDHAVQWRALRDFSIGTEAERRRSLDDLRGASDKVIAQASHHLVAYAPEPDAARTVVRLLTARGRSAEQRNQGHRYLHHLHALEGRWDSAAAEAAEVAAADPWGALELRALGAVVDPRTRTAVELRGLREELREVAAEAPGDTTSWSPAVVQPLYATYLAALISERLGEREAVARAAVSLETGGTGPAPLRRFLSGSLRAHLAWDESDPSSAREALRLVPRPPTPVPLEQVFRSMVLAHPHERLRKAEMLRASGRPEEALGWLVGLVEGTILHDRPYAALAHARMGEIHQSRGRTREAAIQYRRFLALWGGGQGALADSVRARLTRAESSVR